MSGATVFRPERPLDLAMIPETWLHYFNGPNAGFINLEVAQRESPWLFGAKAARLTQPTEPHDQPQNGTPKI